MKTMTESKKMTYRKVKQPSKRIYVDVQKGSEIEKRSFYGTEYDFNNWMKEVQREPGFTSWSRWPGY